MLILFQQHLVILDTWRKICAYCQAIEDRQQLIAENEFKKYHNHLCLTVISVWFIIIKLISFYAKYEEETKEKQLNYNDRTVMDNSNMKTFS